MIEILLTSTVVAGIVAGITSILISERRIAIENVTQERKKWRDRVREISSSINKAIISQEDSSFFTLLRCEFALLLNPRDFQDEAILKCISQAEEGKEEEHAKEFTTRVSLLLKHDWDRAKYEAEVLIFWRKFCQRRKEPSRVSYEEYQFMRKNRDRH